MDYRNNFAHNSVKYETGRGCYLTNTTLDNAYWNKVEETFRKAYNLLTEVVDALRLPVSIGN